jgi:hypothetical protein
MTRVVVHIDRLVLDGFRHVDRHAIAIGLQSELAQVFANPELVSMFSAMGDSARLRVSGLAIAHGAKPQRIGQQVARGIGEEISR